MVTSPYSICSTVVGSTASYVVVEGYTSVMFSQLLLFQLQPLALLTQLYLIRHCDRGNEPTIGKGASHGFLCARLLAASPDTPCTTAGANVSSGLVIGTGNTFSFAVSIIALVAP